MISRGKYLNKIELSQILALWLNKIKLMIITGKREKLWETLSLHCGINDNYKDLLQMNDLIIKNTIQYELKCFSTSCTTTIISVKE